MSDPGPLLVGQVDLDEAITDIDATRTSGSPYVGAWILVRRSGHPVGSFEIEVKDGRVASVDLEHEARSRFGSIQPHRARVADSELPSASVIVPTAMSRPEQLQISIQHLLQLDYPDFEVIVVDNRPAGSATADLPGVKVVRETRPGISAARNAGLAVARGEIIACTDDDVAADRGWLRALGARLVAEPKVACVTGLVFPSELETPAQIWFEESGLGVDRQYSPLLFEREGRFRIKRTAMNDSSELIHSLYATGELGAGANMAFRTDVLRAAGGFDESLGAGTATNGGEDLAVFIELIAAGHKEAYEPSAVVFHTHRRTVEELERQIYGYGTGFTAMLTAVAMRKPSHVGGLAAVVPAWIRSLRDPTSAKQAKRSDSYPADLGRLELRGMVAGPLTYFRARRANRRRR